MVMALLVNLYKTIILILLKDCAQGQPNHAMASSYNACDVNEHTVSFQKSLSLGSTVDISISCYRSNQPHVSLYGLIGFASWYATTKTEHEAELLNLHTLSVSHRILASPDKQRQL
jgi:hypothetical protein